MASAGGTEMLFTLVFPDSFRSVWTGITADAGQLGPSSDEYDSSWSLSLPFHAAQDHSRTL